MSDEFDGCECVWSHEFAMQRLINFIRQNQNACTDTECIDVSGRVAQTGASDSSGFSMAMFFMILAMFMYVVNPSTWSRWTNTKPSRRDNNHHDGSPPQPPPPPAIN